MVGRTIRNAPDVPVPSASIILKRNSHGPDHRNVWVTETGELSACERKWDNGLSHEHGLVTAKTSARPSPGGEVRGRRRTEASARMKVCGWGWAALRPIRQADNAPAKRAGWLGSEAKCEPPHVSEKGMGGWGLKKGSMERRIGRRGRDERVNSKGSHVTTSVVVSRSQVRFPRGKGRGGIPLPYLPHLGGIPLIPVSQPSEVYLERSSAILA
ncbi:hypothetical protein B0H13DRAFT_1879469 [Mycena leptocephala]|nr:hypothetical protein B0H13DRAFT_1879469 [Mycena leptocephala]